MKNILIAILAMMTPLCLCGDADVARALAASGSLLASKGEPDKAKEVLFKALALDSRCGDAALELAKIYESENQTETAAELYRRALPDVFEPKKISYAMSKIKSLDKKYFELIQVLSSYSRSLEDVFRRHPDRSTFEAIQSNVLGLGISRIISKADQPKIDYKASSSQIESLASRIIGKWSKKDGSFIVFKQDKSIFFSADSRGGRWEIIDDTQFNVLFTFKNGVATKCTMTSMDSFVEGSNVFNRNQK